VNQNTSIKLTLPYILIIALLQTLIAVIPGILLSHQPIRLSGANFIMFVYLFISDFYLLFSRNAYQKGKQVSIQASLVKIVFSAILIYKITGHLTYQYAFILFAYEIFQFLTFSSRYQYQDTIFYTLLNIFFKGCVFNLMLTLQAPYSFQLNKLEPFIFSMFIIGINTLVTQKIYSYLKRNNFYLMWLGITLIGLGGYLYYIFNQRFISLFVLIALISLLIISAACLIRTKQLNKKEFILNITSFILLYFYYRM